VAPGGAPRLRNLRAFGLIILLPISGGFGQSASLQVLAPERVIEREIGSGEEHGYLVATTSGLALRAAVEQKGIDLELRIEAPDGRELIVVDSPNGTRGAEVLAFRPETSGDHRLVVMARRRGTVTGSYRLELRELPQRSPREESIVAAEMAATRAAALYRKRGREAWTAAVAALREALAHWRGAGEQDVPGRALYLLGVLHRLLDDPGPALEVLTLARDRFAVENDAAGLATVWNELGYLHWSAGRPTPARDGY